eukprot:15345796-Ditylum_brightwellii.AAC.1
MHLENEANSDQLTEKVKCILLAAHNSAPDVSPVKVLADQLGKTNEVRCGLTYNAMEMLKLNDQVVIGSSVKHVDGIMLNKGYFYMTKEKYHNTGLNCKTIAKVLDIKHENSLDEKSSAVL